MRLSVEATPSELESRGDELLRALMDTVSPLAPELAAKLEKALPPKTPALKYKVLREIHARTQEAYRKTLTQMTEAIGRVLTQAGQEPAFTKSERWVACDLEKAELDWRDALDADWFEKAAGHKYLRRWRGPDGKYRYEYNELAIGTLRTYQVGDKVALKQHGQAGHFEVLATRAAIDGTRQLQVKHDETGHTAWVSEPVLAELFRQEHEVARHARAAHHKLDAAIRGYDPEKGPAVRTAQPTEAWSKVLQKRQNELARLFDPDNHYHGMITYAAQQELHGWYANEIKAGIDDMKALIDEHNMMREAKIAAGFAPSSQEVYEIRKDWHSKHKDDLDRVSRSLKSFLDELAWSLSGHVMEQEGPNKHRDADVSKAHQDAWDALQEYRKLAYSAKTVFDNMSAELDGDKWSRTAKGKVTKAFKALEKATYYGSVAKAVTQEYTKRLLGARDNPVTAKHTAKGVQYFLQQTHATTDKLTRTNRALQSLESAVDQVRRVFPTAVRDLKVWVDFTPAESRTKHRTEGHGEFYAEGTYMPYETGLFSRPGRERESAGKGEITMYINGLRDRIPSATMVHELGHRFYYQSMTPGERDEWRALVKERTTTVSKEDADALWGTLEHNNALITASDGASFDRAKLLEWLSGQGPLGRTVSGVIQQSYILADNRIIRSEYVRDVLNEIGGHSIVDPYVTLYGGSNESEYFAEAFMHYVQGGPRNLPEWTRAIFERLTSRHKLKKSDDEESDLVKAGGPYVGPRGGKWADPEHTIAWQESGGHAAPKGEEPTPAQIGEGHTFELKVHSKIAGRDDSKDTWRVVAEEGDNVKLSRHEGSEYGPWMPRASVKHFQNDLQGKVEAPPSGNPDVDAVTSGKAEFLGKGDDGLAFKVGDKIVKVSTTVPFQPENPGHRSPEQAAAMLKHQVEVGNKLADLGVPGVQRSEFVQHGDKGFQIKPWVEIPEKFTREQLTAIQDSLIAMHKAGYSLNDAVQVGLAADGKPVLFDVGKAAPSEGSGWNSTIDQDFDRLKMLYQASGETFVRRDFSEGQRAWERYQQQAAKFAQSESPNFGHNVLMRATTKLVAEAKDALKGKELKDRLAKIQEQYEDELAMLGGPEKLSELERSRMLKPESFEAPVEDKQQGDQSPAPMRNKTRTPVSARKSD